VPPGGATLAELFALRSGLRADVLLPQPSRSPAGMYL
jgi:hypothetical protein